MLAHPTVISTLHVLCAAPGRPQGGRSRARLPAAGTQLAQLGSPPSAGCSLRFITAQPPAERVGV